MKTFGHGFERKDSNVDGRGKREGGRVREGEGEGTCDMSKVSKLTKTLFLPKENSKKRWAEIAKNGTFDSL